MPRESLGLVQGTVDVLILRALVRASMHGYAVSQWIRERSGGALAVEDAALYQALHRLERKGWVEAEWGVSTNNRRAKFYAITRAGRRRLTAEADQWRRVSGVITRLLQLAPVP